MKKLTLLAVLSVFLLGGCAQFRDHHRDHQRDGRYGSCPCADPSKPQVTVDGNLIKLDQEILVFPRGVSGPVTWSLPANSQFRFADKGIVIEGKLIDKLLREPETSVVLDTQQKEIVDCRRGSDGLSFTCFNRHTVPGVYKYTIRVEGDGKMLVRDPPWVNM